MNSVLGIIIHIKLVCAIVFLYCVTYVLVGFCKMSVSSTLSFPLSDLVSPDVTVPVNEDYQPSDEMLYIKLSLKVKGTLSEI